MENAVTPDEAQAALGRVSQTDALMAEQMRWPLWRHVAFGAVLAGFLAAFPLPSVSKMVVFAAVAVFTVLIVRDDRRRHRLYVSGYQRGRTPWVLLLSVLLFFLAVLAMNAWVDQPLGDPWYWLLIGSTAAIQTAISVLWQRVYQADLRRGRA